jgi:glycosyltransferase involved in cell wall biosynthesis
MKIVLVSQFWPKTEKSGVSLAACSHVAILIKAGHDVEIIGTTEDGLLEDLEGGRQHIVPAKGSGSMYSPIRINRAMLKSTLSSLAPELVIVEGWQTAITESTVDVAFEMGLPILMISHGVSVHAFSGEIKELLRSAAWWVYRRIFLQAKIKKLTSITYLSKDSVSPRFFDRNLAKLGNTAINFDMNTPIIARADRNCNLLLIGYFSRIKNQLAALELLRHLPELFSLTLVGQKIGPYYEKCRQFANRHQIAHRVHFLSDDECALADQISSCLVLLSTSLTEVLPMVLLEAMAAGTPFIATPVGAVSQLNGGMICKTLEERINAVLLLKQDHALWNLYSKKGFDQFKQEFSLDQVSAQLLLAVEKTVLMSKLTK